MMVHRSIGKNCMSVLEFADTNTAAISFRTGIRLSWQTRYWWGAKSFTSKTCSMDKSLMNNLKSLIRSFEDKPMNLEKSFHPRKTRKARKLQ